MNFKYANKKACDLYINDQMVKLHRILEVDLNQSKTEKKKVLAKLVFKEDQSLDKSNNEFRTFKFSPSLQNIP